MKQKIAAGAFKDKCLTHSTKSSGRKELVITKLGRPIARVLPVEQQPPAVFGRMMGTMEILGDIVASTGEPWQAEEQ